MFATTIDHQDVARPNGIEHDRDGRRVNAACLNGHGCSCDPCASLIRLKSRVHESMQAVMTHGRGFDLAQAVEEGRIDAGRHRKDSQR